MEHEEIYKGVQYEVKRWQELRARVRLPVELTPGAIDSLAFMIDKVATDRSPKWKTLDADSVQRYAVATLPNMLNDITRSSRYRNRVTGTISSWELWHAISSVLDDWCPIPKGD